MERNKVVLVDENDREIGVMDKLEAHRQGVLHRAFSIFIFDSNGRMLLQQRAIDKYHGGGLWTNACCSHPQWGEEIRTGALQRLEFEMGLRCAVYKIFSFLYNIDVENLLIENEFDHVFVGFTDEDPFPNPEEVMDYRWVTVGALRKEIECCPEMFTYWFKASIERVLSEVNYRRPGERGPAHE